MANLDEIFAAMPEPTAAGDYEALYIDPATRQIDVPDAEAIFGVESDGQTARKHFLCPRYVGDGLDLAACFLRVNFRTANGEVDAYLVDDLAVSGEYVTFSWELSRKVTQYKGTVQFIVCAIMPGSNNTYPEWNTTLARGEVLEGLEPAGAAAEAATADVIAQLLALVAAQSGNVEAVGAAQVEAVQTEGSTQVGAVKAAAAQAEADALAQIEAKKQNVLADIPEDYTAMGNQVDKLTRSTAVAIVCQAEGETIQVHNSSDNYLQGLRIFGRSTQDGTPTPDTPVEIVSTPAPMVTVCGKNLLDHTAGIASKYLTACETLANGVHLEGRYYVTFPAPIISGKTYTMTCEVSNASGNVSNAGGWLIAYNDGTLASMVRNGSTITAEADGSKVYLYLNTSETENGSADLLNIQLELGETATEYKPHQPLQILTLANGLPGIPVTSGGNYTDANGQQWICDEVDLGRGVYVQRVKTSNLLNYTNSCAQTDNSRLSDDVLRFDFGYSMGCKTKSNILCNRFEYGFAHGAEGAINRMRERISSHETADMISVFINKNRLTSADLAGFKNYLESNATCVQYALTTPVETAIDDVTLEAFRTLHSNKPTTTLLNDAGAWMAAEYVADTKLYIDQKLEALVAASNA